MKSFFKKYTQGLIFSAVIILCVFLIGAAVLLLSEYTVGLEEQARSKVESYAIDTKYLLDGRLDEINRKVHHMAERLALCKSEQELTDTLKEIKSISDYSDVISMRYFKDGIEYNDRGFEFDYPESNEVLEASKLSGVGCVGIGYDREFSTQAFVFYSSVEESELIDSIVVLYPVASVSSAFDKAAEEKLHKAEFAAFCDKDGQVLRVLRSEKGDLKQHGNIFDYFRSTINSKEVVDELRRHIDMGESATRSITVSGVNYVLSVASVGEPGGGMCVIGLYNAVDAYHTGYNIVNTILSTMIIIFAILIFLLIYTVISRRIVNKKIYELGSLNPKLGCYTVLGFQRAADSILKKNRATKFAVVIAEIKYFNYIVEHFGNEEADKLLKYLKVIYSKGISLDETYGYYADGQFMLMLHYKEQRKLIERLDTFYSLARKYPALKDDNYSLKLNFGVYEIERSDAGVNIDSMLDKAIVAKNTMSPSGTEQPIKFYNASLKEMYIQKADVEAKAEGALAGGEFVVFYQPKFDLVENTIAGCEALVRWYDPEKNIYRAPGTFLPVFEANGFISKLDRYVYERVCVYISESIERKQPVYPVSVNISRVTAISEEFKEYYVNLKNRFHIPDGMLVLEFTESFAYENYEVLNDIIRHMQRNGFTCSIDDFGSGYSSYNILKQVNMDEIKLDRFFIKKGISEERDRLILEHVITTAKTLGMNIVQEGVENLDEMNLLRQMGCNVIQGYYYSKPLALVDYIAFINEEHGKN